MINDFVVAGLGVATVFVALICIIFICNVMGAVFSRVQGKAADSGKRDGKAQTETAKPSAELSADAASSIPRAHYVKAELENRGAFIAAVSAVIAEDIGCDISRIRIHSIRQKADDIPDRAKLSAVISSVIAHDTGADSVRIHSIRKI